MKYPRILFVLAAAALLGEGCTPTLPPMVWASGTGCSPKAFTLLEPAPGATHVSFPLTVKARVHNAAQPNCRWTVFEAVAAGMKLEDASGAVLSENPLMTTGDWQTDDAVDFTGTLSVPAGTPAGLKKIIIEEENPSGNNIFQTVTVTIPAEVQ